MAFAEFPYGFLVARRDDGLFFAVVFLGAALADELEVLSGDGRDDGHVVCRCERQFKQVEDACELGWQSVDRYRLVFAVVPHFSPPFLLCRSMPITHNTKNNKNKYIYKNNGTLVVCLYMVGIPALSLCQRFGTEWHMCRFLMVGPCSTVPTCAVPIGFLSKSFIMFGTAPAMPVVAAVDAVPF